MQRDEATRLAREAANEAVSTVFLQLGVNIEDANQLIEFQRDLNAIRAFVRTYNSVRSAGVTALVVFLLTAAVGALWLGVKSSLR